jgi:hypothetical protein
MRKLADRHQIRKRRFEVDPKYRDVCVNRDLGQTRRARKRRSAGGLELDGEDEP